jgi:hypothetical protein
MKIISTIFLIVVFSFQCYCQKCKIYERGVGDISQLPVLETKWIEFSKGGGPVLSFKINTNLCIILFNISVKTNALAKERTFSCETPVVFFFDDSSIISLYPPPEYFQTNSFHHIGLLTSSRNYYVSYAISKEDLEKLATKTLVKVRMYYFPIKNGSEINKSIQPSLNYRDNFVSNAGKKHIKSLSNCMNKTQLLSQDSCFKIRQKLEQEKSDDERILEKVYSGVPQEETSYQNFDEIEIGDIVKCRPTYGDFFYGIVIEKFRKSMVKVKYYFSPGKEVFEDLYYKKLTRISISD